MLLRRVAFGAVLVLLVTGCGRVARTPHSRSGHEAHRTTAREKARAVQPAVPADHVVADAAKPPNDPKRASPPTIKWPRPILEKAISPDGKTVAIWDAKGIYLTDASGKHIVRLRMEREAGIANEHFGVSFCYNRQSTRLAALTQLSGGEPNIAEIDRLYWVNVRRPKTSEVADWEESIQGNGVAIVNRELVGWSADGKSILMRAEVWEGEGMPGAESVRRRSTREICFDVTRPKTWNRDALASHLSW